MGDNDDVKPSGKRLEDETPFPFPLTDVDRWVLSQTDEEFHLQNWDELREIIGGETFQTNAVLIFVVEPVSGYGQDVFLRVVVPSLAKQHPSCLPQ